MSDDEFKFSVKQAPLTPTACELQLAVSVQNEELGYIRASFSRSIAKHQLLDTVPDYQEHPPTKCEPSRLSYPVSGSDARTAPVRTVERAADELVALQFCSGGTGRRQRIPAYRFSVELGADGWPTGLASKAHELHRALQRDRSVGSGVRAVTFPLRRSDALKDMLRDDDNVARRGEELRLYFEQLLKARQMFAITERFVTEELDTGQWRQRFVRSYSKVQEDPELLDRAMRYLRLTGQVLYHAAGLDAESSERVFLRPQWLVDVMKALVHHDLRRRLDTDAPTDTVVKQLGHEFLHSGTLDRRLLPWLWRDLRPASRTTTIRLIFWLISWFSSDCSRLSRMRTRLGVGCCLCACPTDK